MTIPLLVIIDLSPRVREQLEARGFEPFLVSEHGGRAAAIPAATAARAVLTSGSQGLTSDELAALPNVEIICAIGAGFERIDVEGATRRGIPVTNGSGTNATAVADHAMTLLLASAGALVPNSAAVSRGAWPTMSSTPQSDFRNRRVGVTGRKLGILGLGTIGAMIARRAANGFAMEVAYHNRQPVEGAPYMYVDTLGKLATWSEFLVLAAPGGESTHHIVSAEILDQLGPQGYLVNIGRGTVVDTTALIDALTAGRLAGAALDVVEGEPHLPERMLAIDNLLLTPHMAGRTPEAAIAMGELAVANLSNYFSGKPLRNRLNEAGDTKNP